MMKRSLKYHKNLGKLDSEAAIFKRQAIPTTPFDISIELNKEYTRYPLDHLLNVPYVSGLNAAKGAAKKIIANLESQLLRQKEQRIESMSYIAPLYVRFYIEHITTRLMAGESFNPDLLRKALLENTQKLYTDDNAVTKEQQEVLKALKEDILYSLNIKPEEVEEEVDTILRDAQKKMAVQSVVLLMELTMKDKLRLIVSFYYTFWVYILKSNKLSRNNEIIVLKDLMKKNRIEKVEVMAREVISLWIRTLAFGMHTPPRFKDITLDVLLQGLRAYGMLFWNTTSVVTTLFQFSTCDGIQSTRYQVL